MRLQLVRHTRPDVGDGICYGQTDLDVAASFPDEAKQVSARLDEIGVMVSSPLLRCRRLARCLAKSPFETDARLMEIDFGAWEGKEWSEIDRCAFDWWSEDVVGRSCPNGESYACVYQRSIAALSDLCGRGAQTITVVTHGGVIRALLAHVLSMALPDAFSIDIDFGSRTVLAGDAKRLRVACVNC